MPESEPAHLDCERKCEKPAGWLIEEVPPPRHKWADVHQCPNCGKFFLFHCLDAEGKPT
jgi:hypothetical protein